MNKEVKIILNDKEYEPIRRQLMFDGKLRTYEIEIHSKNQQISFCVDAYNIEHIVDLVKQRDHHDISFDDIEYFLIFDDTIYPKRKRILLKIWVKPKYRID